MKITLTISQVAAVLVLVSEALENDSQGAYMTRELEAARDAICAATITPSPPVTTTPPATVAETAEPTPVVVGTCSLAEADRLLGLSSQTSYRLRKEGTYPVPVDRVGGRNSYRVRKADLAAYLAPQSVTMPVTMPVT